MQNPLDARDDFLVQNSVGILRTGLFLLNGPLFMYGRPRPNEGKK